MTVCIGALCASSEDKHRSVAVVATDRMVTWGFTEFEHEEPKMNFIGDKAVLLTAGDSLRGGKVARAVQAAMTANMPIEQLAQLTMQIYCRFRDEQVELEQFRSRGLTREKFYKGESPPLQAQHFFGIDQFVLNFNFNLELLLAGVDDIGSHLFSVGHPAGTMHDWGPIGFQAIGSGGIQAVQSMIGFSHSTHRTLAETVFAVYASKRRAEAAPGVGKDTDLTIIDAGGSRRLDKTELGQLEKAFENYLKPVSKDIIEQVSKMLDKTQVRPPNGAGKQQK